MLELIYRVTDYIVGLFRSPPSEFVEPEHVSVAQPEPRRATPIAEIERSGGEFYFREAILDQLDYYMTCVKGMRAKDPDAYSLYSEIGAHVVPSHGDVTMELSPWFLKALPSFGAVFMTSWQRTDENVRDFIYPRFFYFQKYDKAYLPSDVQQRPSPGAVYIVTAYWVVDREDAPRWARRMGAFPAEFPLLVRPDGTIKLLRVRHPVRLPGGREVGGRWIKSDPFFETWAKERGDTVERHLSTMFAYTASMYEMSNASVIRVTAQRDGVAATFSVNVKRTPYFFRDREVVLNERGNRKRIFHIVRPHLRQSGKAVKLHFRGEKKFDWGGYKVAITVPGRDHEHITEFNVSAVDANKFNRSARTLSMGRVASAWRAHILSGKRIRFGS
jgi:hypothetical protein